MVYSVRLKGGFYEKDTFTCKNNEFSNGSPKH